eukprot:3452039-Prymnesium_polylepis.1
MSVVIVPSAAAAKCVAKKCAASTEGGAWLYALQARPNRRSSSATSEASSSRGIRTQLDDVFEF